MARAGIGFQVRVRGGERTRRVLEKMENKSGLFDALEEGIVEGGDKIIEEVKKRAPKDTGHLRASYGHFTPQDITSDYSATKAHPDNWNKPINKIKKFKTQVKYTFGSQLDYSVKQEYWPRPHQVGESPYQLPSVIAKAKEVAQAVRKSLVKYLRS